MRVEVLASEGELRPMGVNFQTRTLGDCAQFLSGGTPSKGKPSYWQGNIPWFSCKDMKVPRLYDAKDHLSEEGSKNGTRLVPPGTILIVVRGMILAKEFPVAMVMREVAFNQDLKALRCKAGVDPWFLYYWLLANSYEIRGLADEAAHGTKRLQSDRLLSLEVKLPLLETQCKIASILSAYDDLVENNSRRIKILEEMAQAIYREWFLNFRFPGHEKVRMVDSPLGRVPEGWGVGRLDDALVLQRGFDLPKKKRVEEGCVPVFAATGLNGHHNEAKVKAPCVITGRSGSLGTVIYVDKDFWPLNTTLWVKEFRRATPIFTFYLLCGLGLAQYNAGAAVPTLNRNDIHGLPVVLPPKKLLEAFESHLSAIFKFKKVLEKSRKPPPNPRPAPAEADLGGGGCERVGDRDERSGRVISPAVYELKISLAEVEPADSICKCTTQGIPHDLVGCPVAQALPGTVIDTPNCSI